MQIPFQNRKCLFLNLFPNFWFQLQDLQYVYLRLRVYISITYYCCGHFHCCTHSSVLLFIAVIEVIQVPNVRLLQTHQTRQTLHVFIAEYTTQNTALVKRPAETDYNSQVNQIQLILYVLSAWTDASTSLHRSRETHVER